MKNVFWKLLVDNQQRLEELRLEETAVLIYEVEVRAKLKQGPFPSTVTLTRVEGEQETVVLVTQVKAPLS